MEKTTSTTMDVLASAFVRPDPDISTAVYPHMYGGIAKEIYVSREGFARLFEVSPEYLDDLPINCKVFDVMYSGCEMLGYIITTRNNRRVVSRRANLTKQYRVTYIDYGYSKLVRSNKVEMN